MSKGKKGLQEEDYDKIRAYLRKYPLDSQAEIARKVGFSNATVCRVNRSRNYKDFQNKYWTEHKNQNIIQKILSWFK